MLSREIDFVTENSLPARGWKTPPKSSFFTGATVARPEIWPAKDFRDPFARKQGRSGHFGVGKWRFIAPIRHRNSSFSTDFRRLKMQNFGQILRIWTYFWALNSSNRGFPTRHFELLKRDLDFMFQFQFHRILFNQHLARKKLWCYFRGESTCNVL